MTRPRLILIADDDDHIREVVRFALRAAGFVTAEANDGASAVARFEELNPDLMILDIVMPEMEGTDVCRSIRLKSRVPIIFLSSRDEEIDRVLGLELGGDDYITKPFSPRELVARVKAVLRRTETAASPSDPAIIQKMNVVSHGLLKLDQDRYQVYWADKEVVLTVTEFGIIRTLMRYPGKVFSRDELMSGAYPGENVVSDRTIDSHIRRVRLKFSAVGEDPIETVHGLGYRLSPCR